MPNIKCIHALVSKFNDFRKTGGRSTIDKMPVSGHIHKKVRSMRKIGYWNHTVTAMSIAALLLLFGCMGAYGRTRSNPDLTNAFKKQLDLPDYNYYYCGHENLPYAVVGIDPRYEFQDRLWHKIETKADVYKKAAGVIVWNDNWSRGADILDPEGKRIGIWFSYYNTTTVKVGPGNAVAVYNPYQDSPRHNFMDDNSPPR
jgi:hypothetical protein